MEIFDKLFPLGKKIDENFQTNIFLRNIFYEKIRRKYFDKIFYDGHIRQSISDRYKFDEIFQMEISNRLFLTEMFDQIFSTKISSANCF